MARRLIVVLCLWAIGVTKVFAPFVEAQAAGTNSLVFLFDVSFSMSLRADGGSRLEESVAAAQQIVSVTRPTGRWAVLAFEDGGALLGNAEYTAEPSVVRAKLAELVPWGRSPIVSAVESALSMIEGPARLIVFSDLLESEPITEYASSLAAAIETARSRTITIDVVYTPLDTPAQSTVWAGTLAESTGGGLHSVGRLNALVSAVSDPLAPGRDATAAAGTAGAAGAVRATGAALASARAGENRAAGGRAGDGPPDAPGPGVAAGADPAARPGADSGPGGASASHEGVPIHRRSSANLDKTRAGLTARGLSWILLAAAAPAAAYVVLRYRRWREAVLAVEAAPPRPVFEIAVTDAKRAKTVHRLRSFPVVIGNGADCNVKLHSPFPGRSGRSPNIRIERESARAVFSSSALLNVNGAGKRHKVLKKGDRIRYGRYTIEFDGLQWESPDSPSPRVYLRYAALPVAAIVLALVFRTEVLAAATSVSGNDAAVAVLENASIPPPVHRSAPAEVDSARAGAGAAASPTRHALSDHAMPDYGTKGNVPSRAETIAAGEQAAVGNTAAQVASVDVVRPTWNPAASRSESPPLVVEYPEIPRSGQVDILFIHAHPDDEALDYGALAAAADAAGLRTAVVLFTDGSAGLDQYPWREIAPEYPSRRLAGAELARLRIVEAARAMTRLGVDLYVRLGLPNNPYSGLEEELSISDVVAGWGGARALSEALTDIVGALSPAIVVSPDGPSDAYEHFEHEAVGVLTAQVLERIGEDSSIRAHLVPVDPLQTDSYDDVVAFDAWRAPSASASRYRDIQLSALREHRTQRDASVIGVEVRQGLRYEYYRILDWRYPTPRPRDFDALLANR